MNEQQPQSTENTLVETSEPSDADIQLNSLQIENDRLRSELRLRSARDQMLSAFANENARSPALLFEALTPRFEFNDDGSLKNAEFLISGLRKRFPEQFDSEKPFIFPDNTRPNTGAAEPPMSVPSIHAGAGRDRPQQSLTKEALTKMSPQEILALDWNDVKHVLIS